MRQGRTLLSVLLALIFTVPMHAVERTLIDFTTYNENIGQVLEKEGELYEKIIGANPELDIRNFGYPEFAFTADDWNIYNWKVALNSSSSTALNNIKSMVTNATSKKNGNVMGVRLQFNPWSNPFWAKISMPYTLQPTYADGTFVSENENGEDNGLAIGLLANVGQIKNVRSWVYGLNYNYTYGVRVVDQNNDLHEYGMGSIYYEGWRRNSWSNPYYVSDINKMEGFKNPLYPFSYPYIKLDSLVFYKPDGTSDPNFITYVQNVTVDYDLAIVQEETDINNEEVWGILAEAAINQKIATSKRLAEELLLRRNLERTQAAAQGGDNAEAAPADANAADANAAPAAAN